MYRQEALPDDMLIKLNPKTRGQSKSLAKVLDPAWGTFESKDAMRKAIAARKKRKRMRWEKPIYETLKHSQHTKDQLEQSNPKFFSCGQFWGPLTIPEKHIGLLRSSVLNYFTPQILKTQVIPFVTRSDEIPLRLLGWLVVNYVKEFPVVYVWNGMSGKEKARQVNVLQGYNELMKRYHRRHFDPFRRKHRIFFEVEGDVYETTIGQLLFLQWAFVDGVVDYARKHAKAIETHMNIYNEAKALEKEEDKRKGVRHRRSEFVKTKRRQMAFMRFDLLEHDSDFDSSDDKGEPPEDGDVKGGDEVEAGTPRESGENVATGEKESLVKEPGDDESGFHSIDHESDDST